ncbi:MAG: hypothetical protein A3C11_03230 [Candidatus Sungbacteria bacterium RIFCSPHIGHO2_02_FULL_49_12]|uniref:Uncharacterized protein n=2 Tax=Parcubacteria group TaxID=1794811 RepID=A0A1G2CGP7_9BACT|nr:MAG: hypothetical protein A2945_05410 [Candidatus Liptonbacteria bacterium RIFCSPLOWO2_01_FULL_52_25]OHA00429.1 MAG: hypothetical protein A3C11_03230 [Candidatus Sungbacteria bacterium RIFCSPHIGHO2_02_FULL_49_12]
MENFDSSSKKRSVEQLVSRLFERLNEDFVVIGRTHIRSWHAWLVIGLCVGVVVGILLVANNSGEFGRSNAATFTISDRVSANAQTNVRTQAGGGALLGAINAGESGNVTAGPTTAFLFTWWKVKWEQGLEGWSLQISLTKDVATANTPQNCASNSPTCIVSFPNAGIFPVSVKVTDNLYHKSVVQSTLVTVGGGGGLDSNCHNPEVANDTRGGPVLFNGGGHEYCSFGLGLWCDVPGLAGQPAGTRSVAQGYRVASPSMGDIYCDWQGSSNWSSAIQGNGPKGSHDASNATVSTGWTCDPDDYNQAITVHFYGDGPAGSGTLLGAATANLARESAVGDQCGGNANHGFSFSTPGSLKDGNEHRVYAYAINIGPATNNPLLAGSPKIIPVVSGGTIQGYKIIGNTAQQNPPAAETVTLDNGSPNTGNPYFFTNVPAGNHTVKVAVPSGWSVGYTLCINRTDCHGNTPTSGNSVNVDVPAGGYADLWWHYTSVPPSGDCTGGGYTGTNNVVGLSNGDTRFLCKDSRWYDCGWELNDPAWETKAANGQHVGGWTCNLPAAQWQKGTMTFAAKLNGSPWSGSVVVNYNAPNGSGSNLTIPAGTYTPLPIGSYTYSYVSGGPAGATFQNITPSGTQTLAANGTITFTFNFVSQ